MPPVILLVALFTFVIHFIDTLSYSTRLAGVRTGHIALATSLFYSLIIVSRTATVIQAPLLTKYVENAIFHNETLALKINFRFIIFSATLASLAAAVAIPTFHRLMARAISKFKEMRSVPRVILAAISRGGVASLTSETKLPSAASLKSIYNARGLPLCPIFLNVLVTAIQAIGVLSAIYAGTLIASYRATAITLSSAVNFVGTILYFIVVDPAVALMTDETLTGKVSQGRLRRLVIFLVVGKIAGTLLSQVLFLPAATFISRLARAWPG